MKTYKFKRVTKTNKVVTTRIKAESRDEAWNIFGQKFDTANLLIDQD